MHVSTPTLLLTTTQVAEILQLHPVTLKKLRGKGGGPAFVKIGHSIRYRADDVNMWLDTLGGAPRRRGRPLKSQRLAAAA
jgi:predicted DNA-binding transcriptional regulator AlpA